MKKIIYIAGFFIALQFTVRAQSNFVTATVDKISLNGRAKYFNELPVATSRYLYSDSTAIVKDHAYYLQKSKNQRTAGLILLGAGVIISGIGLLVATNQNANLDQTETGVIIMGIGAVSGIVSIPLMIMAHVNRSKAKLMLSSQKKGVGIPHKYGKDLTGITLSIPIGR